MASRPLKGPFQVITSGNMSSNITSAVTIINNLSMVSYSYSWAGTSPVGTVSVQVSNDYKLSSDGTSVINAGTWNSLYMSVNGVGSTTIAVSGNTGQNFADITQTGAYAIRTIYTAGSGSGTLQSWVTEKVQ